MSDRLAVMNAGRVEQLGPPRQVYDEPETVFVADFLGISNLMTGEVRDTSGDHCRVRVGEFDLVAVTGSASPSGAVKLLIRPERIRLLPVDADGENRVPGMVDRVVYRGSGSQIFVRLPNGDRIQVLVQNAGDGPAYTSGDPVRVCLPRDALRVLTGVQAARQRVRDPA